MTLEERSEDIAELHNYGAAAWECVKDAKPILGAILENRQIDCTSEELDAIYAGLKEVSCDAALNQFDKELKVQIARISQERNRTILLERWRTITSTESVRQWSNTHGFPLLWIVPKEAVRAVRTLISVQNKERTMNQEVLAAINMLDSIDRSLLNDGSRAEEAFMKAIGDDYREIFNEKRREITAELKLNLGNDVSNWSVTDLATVQRTLRKYMIAKAKIEKLQVAQRNVAKMSESILRSKVSAFLEKHPEFCDDFN